MLGSPHSFSRARICDTTIFDSLAGLEERTCGFRTVDGGPHGRTRRSPHGVRKARPVHSSARSVRGDAEEFPSEQTTSVGKRDTPSSPHAGSNVRVQYASPIPSSDAHNMRVAANGKTARLLCSNGCRLAAVMADIWFGLDTGQDPGWRMMRSRQPSPIATARPLFVRRATPNTRRRSCLGAASPSQTQHAKPHPSDACAAHWHQRLH
jgi:hypothetical protein